ncbi:galactose-3-O-sulfotransferase 2-like isoform X2 [Crotalus tigris]|uniref:galactose-3-O-sulfotransferase 2-like isoform X2 n=1 Tax=Crotalus tigris TaxID=88082 RepID=UPI00192F4C6B|nr:galactose-3-O-sulfotransferase 2-like isoform X2 [Crotalus tigris]XP_039217005.1 galactose-3-O-sulfotransferase 2-like isoform X2 [Crotalus tigris]
MKGVCWQKHPSKICQPITDVMFLKTHKTASSTILNILYRFSEKHNLTIALPYGNEPHLGYPSPFHASYVEEFKTLENKFNIMGNHLRFNWQQVRRIMPNNTFYFSVLRHPALLLESSYVYYKTYSPAFRKSKNVNEFLSSPWSYYNMTEQNNMYAKNNMWFDFGYNNNAEYDKSYIQFVLKKIEEIFHLILIADFFDESMILLKDFLCWDLDDVIYFKLNARSQQSIQTLNPENKEKVKEWCALDWELYKHFNKSFWMKIRERMDLKTLYKEVDLLQKRQKELMETCLLEETAIEHYQVKDKKMKPFQGGNAGIMGYNLKQDLDNKTLNICKKMIMPELQYTAHLYNSQFPFKKKKTFVR